MFVKKFGLLSKSKMSTSLTGPINEYVSFYPKLVQELFTALWIILKMGAFETEKETLTSIDNIGKCCLVCLWFTAFSWNQTYRALC